MTAKPNPEYLAEVAWCAQDLLDLARNHNRQLTLEKAHQLLFNAEDDLQNEIIGTGNRYLTQLIREHCPLDRCARCGGKLNPGGYCQDETCPFCRHKQGCMAGYEGHPEYAKSMSCTCGSHGEYGTEEDCPKSLTGKHEPDDGFTQADDVSWTADVYCKHCGRSGSLLVNPEEINW